MTAPFIFAIMRRMVAFPMPPLTDMFDLGNPRWKVRYAAGLPLRVVVNLLTVFRREQDRAFFHYSKPFVL